MIIKGTGMGGTTLKAVTSWNPGTTGLPDNATSPSSAVRTAYLIDLGGNDGLTIADMTLDGSGQLHGAVYGNGAITPHLFRPENQRLHLERHPHLEHDQQRHPRLRL